MEIVSILRVLGSHRVLLVAGVVCSLLLGAALFSKMSAPRSDVFTAESRVLIDARRRPAIDLRSSVAETLGLRAGLLADLMMTRPVRAEIAQAAAIDADELAVFGPSMDAPPLAVPLGVSGSEAAATVTERYLLRISAKGAIPVLKIAASAPSIAGASDLVEASQASLVNLISTRSSRGPGLELRPLGPPTTRVIHNDSTPIIGVFAALVFFGGWCAAIVVISGLLRHWIGRRRAPRATRPSDARTEA